MATTEPRPSRLTVTELITAKSVVERKVSRSLPSLITSWSPSRHKPQALTLIAHFVDQTEPVEFVDQGLAGLPGELPDLIADDGCALGKQLVGHRAVLDDGTVDRIVDS